MFSNTSSKSILRKVYLKERLSFSEEEIEENSEQIFKNFLIQFSVQENSNISIFLPIKKFNEIKTQYFIDYLWRNKVNVYVPKIIGDEIISLKLNPETKLIENSWGILEPEFNVNECSDFDFVFTPLLYCDHHGNRIGYGKGFYDNFFSKINKKAIKIGLNLFSPNENIADISAKDVALDYLVTPTEILSFNGLVSNFTK